MFAHSVLEVEMQDIVGEYDEPGETPEWEWVERVSAYTHKRNGQDGIWEFMVSTTYLDVEDAPASLQGVLSEAKSKDCRYILFHQNT